MVSADIGQKSGQSAFNATIVNTICVDCRDVCCFVRTGSLDSVSRAKVLQCYSVTHG